MDSKEEVEYIYEHDGIEEIVESYAQNPYAIDIILKYIKQKEDKQVNLIESLTLALEALEDTNNMNEKYHMAQELAGD